MKTNAAFAADRAATTAEYQAMTKAELVEIARKRGGVKASATKADLVLHLMAIEYDVPGIKNPLFFGTYAEQCAYEAAWAAWYPQFVA